MSSGVFQKLQNNLFTQEGRRCSYDGLADANCSKHFRAHQGENEFVCRTQHVKGMEYYLNKTEFRFNNQDRASSFLVLFPNPNLFEKREKKT